MSIEAAGTSPVLEVLGLSRYFGPRVALENIQFTLTPAEIVFVTGANGAGKSTLLSILAGLLAPSGGEVLFRGKRIRRRSREQRIELGYAGERAFLYGDLTIGESLSLLSKASRNSSDTLIRIEELIRSFGLEDCRERRLRECSQGTVRRAGLVRAFMFSPQVLLLDEPFSNLDAPSEERLLELIEIEQKKGTAFLIAAHEVRMKEALKASTLHLVGGRQQHTIPAEKRAKR